MKIEESIEVLNEFLDTYKNYEDYKEVIDKEIPQAIENVLDYVKRTEHTRKLAISHKNYLQNIINTLEEENKNSISKDKIREKIEQRINTIEKETWYIDNGLEAVNACIEELETLSKELLEEE